MVAYCVQIINFIKQKQDSSPIENEVQPFSCYLYETEDIQVLLKARLEEFPDVWVLAGAQMDTNIPGNRVSDVLAFYLQDLKAIGRLQAIQYMVIPIVKSNHWIGLKVTLHNGTIAAINLFNSLDQSQNVDYLKTLRQDLQHAGFTRPIIAARCMQQIDETSCGPMLVEIFITILKTRPVSS